MKQAIDIEEMLVWAYRDMQADRLGDGGSILPARSLSSWAAIERVGAYGTVVQSSSYVPEPGDCDDARLIDRAVMGLDDAFLAATDGGIAVYDRALIAAEGGRLIEEPQQPVVLATAGGSTVALERVSVSVYLILHARSGTRPDCYADVMRRRGRPNRDGEVAPGLSFDEMIRARAVYAVWHAALGILAADLAGQLARWEPAAPKADEAPWLRPNRRVLEAVSRVNSASSNPRKPQGHLPV